MSVRRIAAAVLLLAIAVLSSAWLPRLSAQSAMACCRRKHAPGKPCHCRHAGEAPAGPRLSPPAACERSCGCSMPAARPFGGALGPLAVAIAPAFSVFSPLAEPVTDPLLLSGRALSARGPPARWLAG